MIEQVLGPTVKVQVRRLRQGVIQDVEDIVSTEEPLEIRAVWWEGGQQRTASVAVTMRTPRHDYELAAGFLYSEGIISGFEAIERISHCQDEGVEQRYNIVNVYLKPGSVFDPKLLNRNFYATSSCGVCGKASLEALEVRGCPVPPPDIPKVSQGALTGLPEELRKAQRVFDRTGGLHAAGLFDARGQLQCLREDVGRHNAVDKLVGWALLGRRLPLNDCLMVVSGRTSYEIMQKALSAGIPMVVGVGAPSSLAVDLARQFGMTLVGFARSDGFNVYSGIDRITG
jgi:FdhD protein